MSRSSLAQFKQLPAQQIGRGRCLVRDRRCRQDPLGILRVARDYSFRKRQQQLGVMANAVGDAHLESGILAKNFSVRVKRKLGDAVQGSVFKFAASLPRVMVGGGHESFASLDPTNWSTTRSCAPEVDRPSFLLP